MRIQILTIFPSICNGVLGESILKRALEKGLVQVEGVDLRRWATGKHRTTDDAPYGGGPGMVMQGEPLARALRSIDRPGRMLFMAPGGRPLTQDMVRELAREDDLTIVCGRYEGIDARLLQLFPLEPVSVGDIVLNGGESAAISVIEAVSRLMPGFMGKEESGDDESFSHGLLEYPHYTRPENFEGLPVPEVLQSGDHARIANWRRQESVRATLRMRPEMLNEAPLYREDVQTLADTPRERPGRNLSFCLVHYPVSLGPKKIGASSLTNLDIHDIARISRSYAMGSFYPVTPLGDQLRVLEEILRHWTRGPGGVGNADRAQALGLVQPATSLEEAVAHMTAQHGTRPRLVASSAVWPAKGKASKPERMPMTPRDVRRWCDQGPVMLCLGTAQGLAPEVLEQCEGTLRPVRFLGYNHLSVRSAAAILADRILGDYY